MVELLTAVHDLTKSQKVSRTMPFLLHYAMLAWHMLSLCVCLSICLSHTSIVSKWQNLGSCKQCHTIAQWL